MNAKDVILNKLEENNGYITTKEVNEIGINRYYLSKLVSENKIERIKKGVFRKAGLITENEIVEVSKLVPNGVFCLETALDFYNLTTNLPYQFNIAIPIKSKVRIPEYPPIKLFYFSPNTYNLGISKTEIDGNTIKIYDIEKTICDIARYRNKIGHELFLSCIKEYMNNKNRNLNQLVKSKKLLMRN